MRRLHNAEKGETLIELVVTLAILAILTTMVLSFATTVSRQVRYTDRLVEATDELPLTKNTIRAWLSYYAAPENILTFADNRITAQVGDGDDAPVYSLYLEGGVLHAEYPDDDRATTLFHVLTNSSEEWRDGIRRFTLTYRVDAEDDSAEQTISFLITPRAKFQRG